MKTIIAGGRDFCAVGSSKEMIRLYRYDLKFFESCMDSLDFQITEVVSGRAHGTDMQGERWANQKNIHVETFPADWSLGRGAGHIRNKQMADYADALVAFWNGVSKGTESMIQYAKDRKLTVRVFYHDTVHG